MTQRFGSRRRGFTIIELLIVVIVIGVLAAAGIAKYQGFAESARSRTCVTNQSTIESAIGMWGVANTELPENSWGAVYFMPDGYCRRLAGTRPAFRRSYGIANEIKDSKAFMCPKIISDYQNNIESIPITVFGWNCWINTYCFYYDTAGYGGWNNGGFAMWYDPAGNSVSHSLVWCPAYGGYNCDLAYPTLRKVSHTSRWGRY